MRQMVSFRNNDESSQSEPASSSNEPQPVFVAPFVHQDPPNVIQRERVWYLRIVFWRFFNVIVYVAVVMQFILFAFILLLYFNVFMPWIPVGATILLFGATNIEWAKTTKVNIVAIILQVLSAIMCLIFMILFIVKFAKDKDTNLLEKILGDIYRNRIIIFSIGIIVYSLGACLAILLWRKVVVIEMEQNGTENQRMAVFTVISRPVAVELNLAPVVNSTINGNSTSNNCLSISQPSSTSLSVVSRSINDDFSGNRDSGFIESTAANAIEEEAYV